MASCDPCSRPHFEWDKVYVDDDDDDDDDTSLFFILSVSLVLVKSFSI